MFARQTLPEQIVSKDGIVNDLKEEDLACAKDLICTIVNCQDQNEVKDPGTGIVSAKVLLQYSCVCRFSYMEKISGPTS